MISRLYSILYLSKGQKWELLYYRIVKVFLNTMYPIYCKLAKRPVSLKNIDEIIVSLTSFPARISSVHIVIETLLRQTYKPEKIILWLADSEFKCYESLPIKLRELTEKGLEIKFCDDIKSHKKYYYTMKDYPNHTVITVDDDTFYPEDLIENLVLTSKKYPNSICCNLAHKIKFDDRGDIKPYIEWYSGAQGCEVPSDILVPIGCEGVLYPPQSLDNNIFDKEQILRMCPLADDLWLKAMGTLNGCKAVKVRPDSIPFANLLAAKESSLNAANVGENKNDEQLKAIVEAYPELKKIWKKS